MPRFRVPECKHTARGACTHVACRYHEQRAIDACVLVEIGVARGAVRAQRIAELLGVSHQRVTELEHRALFKMYCRTAERKRELLEALRHLDQRSRPVEPPEIEHGDLPDLSDRDARKPWIRRG